MRKIMLVLTSALVFGSMGYTQESTSPASKPATIPEVPAIPAVTAPSLPKVEVPKVEVPAIPTAVPAVTAPSLPTVEVPKVEVPAPAPSTASTMPAAKPLDLSGKWVSNSVGEVTLAQTGDKIAGTYQYVDDDGMTQEGKMEGVVKDKMIQATWWERPKVGAGDESRGTVEWKVSEDGKTLTGWYMEEGESEKEDFNLTR